MQESPVAALVASEEWTLLSGHIAAGPFLLRHRTPVLAPPNVDGYDRYLRVLWAYADEDSGAMPDADVTADMNTFEDRISQALEHDAAAVLVAVLTLDGARQWVFYTRDISECGVRINSMPQEEAPYPIDLDTQHDPAWSYLHAMLQPVEDGSS